MKVSCNVSMVNATCQATTLAPWYTNSFNVLMVVLYVIVISAALLGNILVCIAVYINPKLRQNAASFFIVSLAISDIGTASFAMSFDVESLTVYRRWFHGEVLCIVWTTAYLITVPSSIWNLFVMSVDRYKTLKNPWNRFKESHTMTARRAVITITILWAYCLGFALLPVMAKPLRPYAQSVFNNYCRFNISVHYSVVGSFLNFYLPMFAMCGIYYKVYHIAHAHRKCPLVLETNLHKISTNESQTAASTLYNADSLTRPSIDQQHSYDGNADNKQDNVTVDTLVGLENVSFFLDENSGNDMNDSTNGAPVDAKIEPKHEKNAKDVEKKHENQKTRQQNDTTPNSGYFDSSLKAAGQYSLEKKDLSSTIYNANDKICLKQLQKLHDIQDHDISNVYCGVKKNENEKSDFSESDTKGKSISTKASLSRKTVAAVSDHLGSFERDKSPATQSGFKKSFNNVLGEKIIEKPKPLTVRDADTNEKPKDQPKIKSSLIKSSSDYSLNKEGGRLFSLEKKLKQKSDEEVCRLKKFNKKSDDDETLSSVRDERGKVNDTLTYSNKRKLKHFAMNTKAARTISIIVGAFLTCWIPFTSMSVGLNICGPPCYRLPNLGTWMDVLLWMGYLNSALNPFLFSYQNLQFKKSYRQIGLFLCHWLNICKCYPS